MATMLEIAKDCFEDLYIYSPPYITERLMAVSGCHIANLCNMLAVENKRGGITKHGRPENLRQHCAIVIPSGFGKSTYLRSLFHDLTGLMGSQTLQTSVRATFSKEAWLGTHLKNEGEVTTTDGIFQRFKHGIVAADEYARLSVLMCGDGIEHDEVYLLTALDTDMATKDLSTGSIELKGIATTIVAGMRIPHEPLAMTSGLSRRFTFELFLPTLEDSKAIKDINRNRKAAKYDMDTYRQEMEMTVRDIMDGMMHGFPTALNYSAIEQWCDARDIPHFEEDIYKRLAVGFSVATGHFPIISLTPELESLFNNEIGSRQVMKSNTMAEAVARVVRGSSLRVSIAGNDYPGIPTAKVTSFFEKYYQLQTVAIRSAISGARGRGLKQDTVRGESWLFQP